MKTSPAESASIEALDQLRQSIQHMKCFRLEAGAGAGKTYSLIESLRYLLDEKSSELLANEQQIACITYTNVAKNEIKDRTDNHPAIFSDTIHTFCWSLLNRHQDKLRSLVPTLGSNWTERVEKAGGIKRQIVKYELGYPNINEDEISLHHDDVVSLMAKMLSYTKFQDLIKNKFPFIFIDEYQDTNKELAESIVSNLVDNDSGVVVGLFGDHWQKIYGSSACGLIQSTQGKIKEIGKKANFRSDRNIVHCLNRMRPELPQAESKPESEGVIKVFTSDSWEGERRQGNHWKGDLPAETAKDYVEKVRELMSVDGWELSPDKTKILLLTNNLIANEQGFSSLASCFRYSDDYLKKADKYIAFFLELLEPSALAFERGAYGELFQVTRSTFPSLSCQNDKKVYSESLKTLLALRETGNIGEMLDFLKSSDVVRLPPKIEQSEDNYYKLLKLNDDDLEGKEKEFVSKLKKLRSINYSEVIALSQYIDNMTPFSTKHGVKGAQFDNVIVVCGRGWNQYNWDQMLTWMKNGYPKGKETTFERNRNLFYVSCSRAKHNLTLLFTQQLSDEATLALNQIFGEENILGSPFDS